MRRNNIAVIDESADAGGGDIARWTTIRDEGVAGQTQLGRLDVNVS